MQVIGLQLAIQRLLAGVAKGRMSDVMNQRQGLDQLFIQFKGRGSSASDLSHFNRMGESAAEMIGIAVSEYLCFACQAAKGSGVNDSITITLKWGAIGVRIFRILACSQRIGRIADHCAAAERSCLHERVESASARSEPRANLLSPA